MIYEFRFRLTSPILANKVTPERIRRFIQKNGELCVDLNQVNWALEQSAKDLKLTEAEWSAVHFPITIRRPTLQTYCRRYFNDRQERKEENFECIGEKTVLTMPLAVADRPAQTKPTETSRGPTHTELRAALSHAGEHYGFSQWGANRGFGRFVVVGLVSQ